MMLHNLYQCKSVSKKLKFIKYSMNRPRLDEGGPDNTPAR
jgi:hypothetical protein